MKLSQVLKDWPEKMSANVNCIKLNALTMDDLPKHNNKLNDTEDQIAIIYNTALTSCDREIDKEALAKILSEYIYLLNSEDMADQIISTMPTWLKPTERK